MAKKDKETMEQREQTGTRSRSAESRQRKTEGQQLPDIPNDDEPAQGGNTGGNNGGTQQGGGGQDTGGGLEP
jgi:hypothetical protein